MCCIRSPCDALRVALIRFSHPVFPLAAPGPLPSADNETVMRQLRINTISALVSALAIIVVIGVLVAYVSTSSYRMVSGVQNDALEQTATIVARSAENYIRAVGGCGYLFVGAGGGAPSLARWPGRRGAGAHGRLCEGFSRLLVCFCL